MTSEATVCISPSGAHVSLFDVAVKSALTHLTAGLTYSSCTCDLA